MWAKDTPRTTVKGFYHRLITRGPPVRQKLFRLNRIDTEWVDRAVREDVKKTIDKNSLWETEKVIVILNLGEGFGLFFEYCELKQKK